MVSAEDAQLLQAWRAGDQQAGDRLLRRHFQSLYRFFRNKVDGGVEDLIQKTLLTCVERRDKVREAASFRAYMFAVARNELYRQLETFRRDRQTKDISDISVEDLTASPGTIVAKRREQKLLLRALRTIPLALQIVLELHYWEKLSTAELAQIFEAPQGTIKSRLRRAREALTRRISELGTSADIVASTVDNLDRWAQEVRDAMTSTNST